MKPVVKGYLALATTSIVWGTTWVASKMATKMIHPLQIAWVRQMFAGLCFVAFFLLIKKFELPSKRQFGWLFIMAILMFVFANGLSTWGVKYISSGFGALIGALYPLSVVILQRFFFNQRTLTPLMLMGLVLGVAGVGLVFYENTLHAEQKNLLPGIILSLIAMLSWSLGSIFLSRNKENINPYYGTGWQMIISSVLLCIWAQISGFNLPVTEIPVKAWGLIAFLGVFGSIIAYIAFIYSIKVLPIPIASLYAYLNPIVALIIGAILLGEKITVFIIAGSLVTIAGVFMVNYAMSKRRHLK